MKYLSQHLSIKEITASDTATRKGIVNIPSQEDLARLEVLAKEVFEPTREAMDCALLVTSGYRSEELNIAIGGSKTSQHCKGEALDIICPGVGNANVFNFIKDNLEFDQLIWEYGDDNEPEWVHVSYSAGKNRNQIKRAVKVGKWTKYEEVN